MVKLTLTVAMACLSVVSNGQVGATKSKLVNMDKETLANRVDKVNDGAGTIVRLDATSIEPIKTPFFLNGAIYRVVYLGQYHPVGFTVGVAGNYTVMLPINPDGFIKLKNEAGFKMPESDSGKIDYVVTYLQTTRSFSQKFEIIRDFNDIELIPKPSPEEVKQFESLKQKYHSVIRPPHFGEDAKVIVIAIKQRSLVRIETVIAENGDLDSSEEVLEKVLPIRFTE